MVSGNQARTQAENAAAEAAVGTDVGQAPATTEVPAAPEAPGAATSPAKDTTESAASGDAPSDGER
jgi:hypothetical protein